MLACTLQACSDTKSVAAPELSEACPWQAVGGEQVLPSTRLLAHGHRPRILATPQGPSKGSPGRKGTEDQKRQVLAACTTC